ncbi:hypothetical protein Kpol_1030p19 [Vanderwaltozyma polyspora DSM 70294]|uniref:NAD-dependent epimerase/dehydratase domain-containing protein n=1 Tax=Vanderwaltozyma polyspora (strain ATCC 22028 / DSM 70294 / BCRC 21397 / CBS 2163 / NBRC 10782 / NRRL Y-8283 / UCD 57-17) TaxID=436907 RepID=A7TMT9_VANPO|nr:uncharacterized protein Kpol_1030p19 [Vanderwaltozyma polyspora DSM 70294]EDO16411.1 hypothetical protein Kpol_1030p19 [Vanderwaltozyma polyspora DSM 70294]
MSVLVTGATGYIALHVIDLLLKENYRVIGTVRSKEKAAKLEKQFNYNKDLTFEIVEDIANLSAFDHVIKNHANEINYVIHMASPVTFTADDFEKDILIPAVNGTKGILESIKQYAPKSVKKFVITSSIAAMMDLTNPTAILTEQSWNPTTWEQAQENGIAAYSGSKKFAEKAAWNFLEENKGIVDFKLTTINPVFVFGPQKFDEDAKGKLNSSCEIIKEAMFAPTESEIDKSVFGSYVDVRDVARAHVCSLHNDELTGKRLILSNASFTKQNIVNIMNKRFPQLKGKIAPADNSELPQGGRVHNEKTKALLGYIFKDLEEIVVDMADQILKVQEQ